MEALSNKCKCSREQGKHCIAFHDLGLGGTETSCLPYCNWQAVTCSAKIQTQGKDSLHDGEVAKSHSRIAGKMENIIETVLENTIAQIM